MILQKLQTGLWEEETENLKQEFITALEKELYLGFENDKKETVARKKAYEWHEIKIFKNTAGEPACWRIR